MLTISSFSFAFARCTGSQRRGQKHGSRANSSSKVSFIVRSRKDYHYELSSSLSPAGTRMSSYKGCDNNRVNDDVVDLSLTNRPKRISE
jgi:hypothetical protein